MAAGHELVGVDDELARALHDLATEGSQFAAVTDAVEQRLTQLFLQRLDAAAQGWLREKGLGWRCSVASDKAQAPADTLLATSG